MSCKTPSLLTKLSPLAAAIAFAITVPATAYSKNFVINTDKDKENDGKTSLREAFAEIQDEGEGGDHTITFDSSLSGKTIEVEGLYLSDTKLTIDGSGAEDLTLSLNGGGFGAKYGSKLILQNLTLVQNASEVPTRGPSTKYAVTARGSDVTIDNVNFTQANQDVYSFATVFTSDSNVSINNSRFDNLNSAMVVTAFNGFKYAGKKRENSLTITNSSFDNVTAKYSVEVVSYSHEEGEGNFSKPITNVVIANSSFTNNPYGGALGLFAISEGKYDGAPVAKLSVGLEGLTIANNYGEGVSVVSAYADTELAVVNSTIVGNKANYGAAIQAFGLGGKGHKFSLAIAQSTVVGNRSENGSNYSSPAVSIYAYSDNKAMEFQLEIANSIIANNQRTFLDDDGKVTIDSDVQLRTNKNKTKLNVRNSLIGVEEFREPTEDNEGEGGLGSRIIGSDNLFGVEPMLGALADNGGSTLTMSPLAGSPVINAGNKALVDKYELKTDQRGLGRILGGAPDMGAVEYCEEGSDCNFKKKKGGLFGSFGFHYLTAAFGLAWLRRRKQN